jgi:hypothetical protein
MTIARLLFPAITGLALCAAGLTPGMAISPCSDSSNPATRKTNTNAGIACRDRNLNIVLSQISGRYDLKSLRRCLEDAKDELDGLNGKRGAGRQYYEILNRCQSMARAPASVGQLDSASNSDCLADDESCNVRNDNNSDEAKAMLGTFMEGNPEPGEAE